MGTVAGTGRRPLWRDSDSATQADHCCWPDCEHDLYEPAAGPPMCLAHLIRCATFISGRLQFALANPRVDAASSMRADLARRSQVLEAQSQVYYLRVGDHVKIGFTGNLKTRLIQLRADADDLLAAEPGGRDIERQRHLEFAEERVGRRENFNPSRRLLAHIEAVRERHGEPVMTTWPEYELWHTMNLTG